MASSESSFSKMTIGIAGSVIAALIIYCFTAISSQATEIAVLKTQYQSTADNIKEMKELIKEMSKDVKELNAKK